MLSFDKAIGVGRHLSAIQHRMLLDLENWPEGETTAYNLQELIWTELIFRSSWSPQHKWSDRGLAVVMALQMRALSNTDVSVEPGHMQHYRCRPRRDRRPPPRSLTATAVKI